MNRDRTAREFTEGKCKILQRLIQTDGHWAIITAQGKFRGNCGGYSENMIFKTVLAISSE